VGGGKRKYGKTNEKGTHLWIFLDLRPEGKKRGQVKRTKRPGVKNAGIEGFLTPAEALKMRKGTALILLEGRTGGSKEPAGLTYCSFEGGVQLEKIGEGKEGKEIPGPRQGGGKELEGRKEKWGRRLAAPLSLIRERNENNFLIENMSEHFRGRNQMGWKNHDNLILTLQFAIFTQKSASR